MHDLSQWQRRFNDLPCVLSVRTHRGSIIFDLAPEGIFDPPTANVLCSAWFGGNCNDEESGLLFRQESEIWTRPNSHLYLGHQNRTTVYIVYMYLWSMYPSSELLRDEYEQLRDRKTRRLAGKYL